MTDATIGPRPKADFDIYPTREEVNFFRENGYLVVERITTDEELAWIRRVFDHIFSPAQEGKEGSPVDRSGSDASLAKKLTQSFFPEIQHPELLNTAFRRNAKRYSAALLDLDESLLTSWGHMIMKYPGGPAAQWHQDHAYWQPEFSYCALGCWLALQDTTEDMGAMQFIPGSHKRGLLHHRHLDDPAHNVLKVSEPFDESAAVACPLKSAGATFHHSETLHYTAPNTTDRLRAAFPMEFQIVPVRRDKPEYMPWVEERRNSVGGRKQPDFHVLDGKMVPA